MRNGRKNKTLSRFEKTPQTKYQSENKLPRHHLADDNLVNNTRDAHFAEVRCTTRGTECLPINLLCIGHFTTHNESREKSTRDSSSGQQNTEYTHYQQDRDRVYNISIHHVNTT